MRKNIQDIYKVLVGDETLLRLLYYIDNTDDKEVNSPLNPSKTNILSLSNKWDIIQDIIKTTPKIDDLDSTKKCRVLIFPGDRDGTGNYLVSDQQFYFDTFVHTAIDNVDQRLSWICDTLNELICNKNITGFGKILFVRGRNILSIQNYLGYRLIFEFSDLKGS